MRVFALRRDDANPAGLARPRLPPNHDLDIAVERRQEVHQPFHREARQLVMAQCRDLRLRDSQHLGSISLR